MRRLLLLPALCVALPVAAQVRVAGVVVDSASGTPLSGARIVAGAEQAVSDPFGRFGVTVPGFPATLRIARIGARPLLIELRGPADTLIRALLVAAPIRVADLIVGGGEDPSLRGLGQWSIPTGTEALLPTVGRDVMRDLLASPSVSQSTIVSARPLIRGYDPNEVTIRLDGFDLPNPWHIGRAFSAIPVDGVEQVTVATAPLDPSVGATSGAAVELTGRTGVAAGMEGGVALDPVSISGFAGGSPAGLHTFGTARMATIDAVASIAGVPLDYRVRDGYASVLADRDGTPWLRGTFFASRDEVQNGETMDWGVALAGLRADVWRRGGHRVELHISTVSFDERIRNIELDGSALNVTNEFSRAGGGGTWTIGAGTERLVLGADLARRHIVNKVDVLYGTLLEADRADDRSELGLHALYARAVGRASVALGGRYDRAGSVSAFQPRVRAELPIGGGWTLGTAAGRSAKLYHTTSDPRGIPELVFYDLWFVAGDTLAPRGVRPIGDRYPVVPVAEVDHAFVTLGRRGEVWSFQGALYASRGKGMVEVRPETAPPGDRSGLRFGRARTRGFEVQAGRNSATRSMMLSYALTWSERDWGEGWIPWSLDRRHLLRLTAQTAIGGRWRFTTMAEVQSAAPLTPVDHLVQVQVPGTTGGIDLAYVYGPEASARGQGTFRIDAGVARSFGGPWGARGTVTASVTNLNFGGVAPLRPVPPGEVMTDGRPVRYERTFDLPAIPTIGFRLEF